MHDQQNQPDQVEVMVIRIGDIAIVGMPGEPFSEIGQNIKLFSPAKRTLIFELANGGLGYFPDRKAFTQGGYEVTAGATNYEPGSAEKLVESAVRQLKILF
jgi:hypothetical protein